MKNCLLPFLLLVILFSCKKEQGDTIDYNRLVEERILEVAAKPVISAEDIAPLERMLEERISDAAVKSRLTEMLNSVKRLTTILPLMEQLRSDPNINFLEKYEEVYTMVDQLSDYIPRKAILLKELEDNKDGYDSEEVRFTTSIAQAMKDFLKVAYNIEPIPGKDFIAFYRGDIDKVDSLSFGGNAIPYEDLLKFSALKNISMNDIASVNNAVINLNKFTQLRRLYLQLHESTKLNIDSLKYLTHVVISGRSALDRLDLTGTCDSLVSLTLGNTQSLKSLILPDKQFLTNVSIEHYGNVVGDPAHIDTLIVEGGGNTELMYTAVHPEVGLVKISGLKSLLMSGSRFIQTGEYNGIRLGYNETVKIKKLEMQNNPNMQSVQISLFNFPAPIDLGLFKQLKELHIGQIAFNATDPKSMEYSYNDILGLTELENVYSIMLNNINWPENTTLDLRKLKKLLIGWLHSEMGDWEEAYKGPAIKKVILSKSVKDNVGEYGETFMLYPDESITEIEYVD